MADRHRKDNFKPAVICTPRELIVHSSKLLSTFNEKEVANDAHLQAFIKHQNLRHEDEVFLSEVFAGCVRYAPLLKVVVDGYYASDGKICLKSESSLYRVITYLIMFRLDDLGMVQFKRLISSQSTTKMLRFLKFFFDKKNLHGWITDEWCKSFDKSFVNDKIISQIKRHESEINEFIEVYLKPKDSHTLPPSNSQTIPNTEVKPFNLTNPRPRRIPTPEKIPAMRPYKPVPESTYIPPRESELVKNNKDTLKLRAEEKAEEAERMKFSCANTEKSSKTKNVIKQILEEREAELETVSIKPRPYPMEMMTQEQPTKLNTAAILREGARISKAVEDENKKLADLEAGLKDNSEYEKWQDEARQRDEEERMVELRRKHLESKLSYEEAILAKQNHILDTQEKVGQIKEEYDEIMREYFSRKQEERKNMRRLVEEVMKGHKSAKDAKVKLQQMKQKIVQQVEKESQDLMSKALEQAEQEMRQKVELIQQIRAMESVPVVRTKFIDQTETSGQGLLAEMSLVELHERLSLMKIYNEEAKEKKRKEIATAKKAKEKLISETLEAIDRSKAQNDARKNQGLVRGLKRDLKDEKLLQLELKLESKRKVREQLKKDRVYSPSKNSNISTKLKAKNDPINQESSIDTLLRATAEVLSSSN